MLPRYLKVVYPLDTSIHARHESVQYFDNPWHFHPELEINLILKGTGTRFVGDNAEEFKPDDLVLLGSNIPHYWKSDRKYYDYESKLKAEAIILRFNEQFLGAHQNDLPEIAPVKNLFYKAKRGIKFKNYPHKVIASLKKIPKSHGLDRMILFLEVLNTLVNQQDYYFLSSEGFMEDLNPGQEKRMNEVYNFITNNFQKKLTIQHIAQKANMNPSAFSRYFKQHTGKSVTQFLQDLRVGYACKLLIQTDKTIAEILFESGFNNQAHFNKLFFGKMGRTPGEYREGYNGG